MNIVRQNTMRRHNAFKKEMSKSTFYQGVQRIGMPLFIKKLDLFGTPYPIFNIDGSSTLTTNTGGVFSILIFYVVFVFGVVKFAQMFSRDNPSVNTYFEKEVYTIEDKFNMVDEEFMVAFSLEDYNTGEAKTDPNYVKMYALYSDMVEGKRKSYEIPLHPCDDSDWELFYPVEANSEGLLKKFKTDPKKTLFCLDRE